MAAAIDLATIIAAAIGAEAGYNSAVHGWNGMSHSNLQLCLFVAVLFVVMTIVRRGYSIYDYLDMSGHARRTFALWNVAFVTATTFAFLTGALEESSRGAFGLFYVFGLLSLFGMRAALVSSMRRSAIKGKVLAARVMLVGFERDIARYQSSRPPAIQGMAVVGVATLCADDDDLAADIAAAVEMARRLTPDEVILVVPWRRSDVIDKCVAALRHVPTTIQVHLEMDAALGRLAAAQISPSGAISGFRLGSHSLSNVDIAVKRAFDMIVALAALIALTPLFLIVAAAIRLESVGPALFLQTRRGFNKSPFRIFKFRSMTTMDDGAEITQAVAKDPRVTRVGAILRKLNIDELPQLINVIRGEMSLVGPRPHALAHDVAFEREVELYTRRHNVKPGITGWAQVNGLRGETDTPEKLRRRIDCDLYYVDNWSLGLDLWIMFLTVFSRKAYKNAY